jgi:hypothetical protein
MELVTRRPGRLARSAARLSGRMYRARTPPRGPIPGGLAAQGGAGRRVRQDITSGEGGVRRSRVYGGLDPKAYR